MLIGRAGVDESALDAPTDDGPMRSCTWVKDDPVGMEHAELHLEADHARVTSVAIGSDPVPYRLDVELVVGPGWVTQSLALIARGEGWATALDLTRGGPGSWRAQTDETGTVPLTVRRSAPATAVRPQDIPSRVLDVDIQYSPVTNLMPIRRLGLERIGATDSFVVAWISVPSLAVTLEAQTYTILGVDEGDHCARFDSADGFFTAVLRCDEDGIVRDYPGIARRLG
jgi:hypothetical protein